MQTIGNLGNAGNLDTRDNFGDIYLSGLSNSFAGGQNGCYVLRTNLNLGKSQFEREGFKVVDADSGLYRQVKTPSSIRPRDILNYANLRLGPQEQVHELYVMSASGQMYSVAEVEQHYKDTPTREQNPYRMAWYTAGAFYPSTSNCPEEAIMANTGGRIAGHTAAQTTPTPTLEVMLNSTATPVPLDIKPFATQELIGTPALKPEGLNPQLVIPFVVGAVVVIGVAVALYSFVARVKRRKP